MLNYNAIQTVLIEKIDSAKLSEERLKEYRSESELLCEKIENGLFAIGIMMEHLGIFADEEKQNFSDQALNNRAVTQLGGLICANAYLLNTLRDTAANATFYLNGGSKGAK